MDSNRLESCKDLYITSSNGVKQRWRPIRLKNLNQERYHQKTFGKSQDLSVNSSTLCSEEATLNLTTSFSWNESFAKFKLQSPKYKRRSEMSMESNELLLTIASAATKSLSTVLAHEQPKDTSTSQKPQLKTKKDFNHKKTDSKITRNLNLKNETQIPTVPHTIEKSPDVSPIRSEVCMTNAEKKQKKSNRPILNKKFDSIFNEKILPVLLKSTKLKPKEVLPENHRKMETKKPENLINRLKAKKK